MSSQLPANGHQVRKMCAAVSLSILGCSGWSRSRARAAPAAALADGVSPRLNRRLSGQMVVSIHVSTAWPELAHTLDCGLDQFHAGRI